jgi:hypothetical protein
MGNWPASDAANNKLNAVASVGLVNNDFKLLITEGDLFAEMPARPVELPARL